MWSPQTLLEPSSYNELISGKIPALIVPGILSKTECASLSSKISNIQTINKKPKKFGTSLSSHIYEKSQYFLNAKKSNDFLKELFPENTSPLIFMRKTRHFPKMGRFLTYLRVPDEGSTRDIFPLKTKAFH